MNLNLACNVEAFLKNENKVFKKLPDWKKRVAIAEDVIAQIEAEVYTPESGVYVSLDTTEEADSLGIDMDSLFGKDMEANVAIAKGFVQCNVCAKGAMFMSHVMKTNSCTLEEARASDSDEDVSDRLEDLFSREQLDLIESAFETDSCHYVDDRQEAIADDIEEYIDDKHGYSVENPRFTKKVDALEKTAKSAVSFGNRYSSDQKRLLGIMQNIIKNKGEFKP